jgi:hypothetical protein
LIAFDRWFYFDGTKEKKIEIKINDCVDFASFIILFFIHIILTLNDFAAQDIQAIYQIYAAH